MTSTKKIILWLAGGFVAMILALLVGGYIWWQRNGAAYTEKSKQAMTEGRTFGQAAAATRCVDETLTRHGASPPTFGTTVEQSAFLSGCLKTASDLPALCAQDRDPGVINSAVWLKSLCTARGLNDRYCTNAVQPVLQACRDSRSAPAPQG